MWAPSRVHLRIPPMTPSVMWMPNSILTATLLLAPPRRWGSTAGGAPGPPRGGARGWLPLVLVLALFATNCSEALIAPRSSGGSAMRRALRHAPRVVVFILGATLLAPFLSSFLDAGVVSGMLGEPFWTVWRGRFFSNVLTELAVVPALAIVITTRRPGFAGAGPDPGRGGPSGPLLVIMGVLGFGTSSYGVIPGVPRSPLALLLPFLLWASVRFGPGGAGLSLLITTLVATGAVTHGATVPTRDQVLVLQIFLTVIGIPMLCLAALIEERRRAEEALSERLRFEELLSRLSLPSCTCRATRWTPPSTTGCGASASRSASTGSCSCACPRIDRWPRSRTPGRRRA